MFILIFFEIQIFKTRFPRPRDHDESPAHVPQIGCHRCRFPAIRVIIIHIGMPMYHAPQSQRVPSIIRTSPRVEIVVTVVGSSCRGCRRIGLSPPHIPPRNHVQFLNGRFGCRCGGSRQRRRSRGTDWSRFFHPFENETAVAVAAVVICVGSAAAPPLLPLLGTTTARQPGAFLGVIVRVSIAVAVAAVIAIAAAPVRCRSSLLLLPVQNDLGRLERRLLRLVRHFEITSLRRLHRKVLPLPLALARLLQRGGVSLWRVIGVLPPGAAAVSAGRLDHGSGGGVGGFS
mmetsp:Transcript_28500/g.58526  ORF Transcript_28500/g.58526 Transcript_28500/m.58526 type:complete len:287 (-) Transcript_28500:227-1087(-)